MEAERFCGVIEDQYVSLGIAACIVIGYETMMKLYAYNCHQILEKWISDWFMENNN